MKILFVHDAEKLKEDKEGDFYTDGAYNIDTWDRYLSLASELSVIFRKDNITYDVKYAKEQFNPVRPNIRFVTIIDRRASLLQYINFNNKKTNNEIIKREVLNCDGLIARLPCDAGYVALKYAKKFNKPYLIEVVGCPWDSLWNHSYKGKFLAFPSYLVMKKSVKDASYVLYVTNEFLQRRYPCKGKSIGCSDVSLPYIDESVLERRLNKINQMSEDKPIVIGTTAAIDVKYKGQEYVIKAISKLNREGYNFEYHLVGGGDDSYLKSVAQKYDVCDKVKIVGSLPHEKVFEYLDKIDIYIQPSMTEGMPRALIEAMSRGCPVIGSNVGGIPELLNDKFIFKKASVNEICELLKSVDKNAMIEEAKRSFEKAKEYDKELLDKRRTDFYEDFVYRVTKP